MTVTAEQLRIYIGATADRDAEVTEDLATAEAMVTEKLSSAWRQPEAAQRDWFVKEVGRELFKRRDSETGASQYADFSTGQPVAGPRDPFARVWPTLRSYVLGF